MGPALFELSVELVAASVGDHVVVAYEDVVRVAFESQCLVALAGTVVLPERFRLLGEFVDAAQLVGGTVCRSQRSVFDLLGSLLDSSFVVELLLLGWVFAVDAGAKSFVIVPPVGGLLALTVVIV